MKKYFAFTLAFVMILFLAACGNNGNTSSKDNQSTRMNLTQIQAGNYSSLQGTWKEVAYAVNALDGKGEQWKAGARTPDADTISVASDKIVFDGTQMVIKGNTLTDSAGSHLLTFKNSGSSLDASNADYDIVANYWDVSFYPKRVTNDIGQNNGVKIDNTKNLIEIWTSYMDYTAVFAQTDTNS